MEWLLRWRRPTSYSSFCSITTLAASLINERSLGKMPTRSVRRPISRLNRSSGLVERSFVQVISGEGVEREQVLLGRFE